MRMLLPKKPQRDVEAAKREMLDGLEPARAESIQAQQQASTKALGSRQEVLASTLEEIARLSEHLRRLDPMVSELKDPLEEELLAHKREHGELITTRAVLEQTADRLAQSQAREHDLTARLNAAEVALAEADAARAARELSLQDSGLEVNRLRNALQELAAREESSAAALRDANLRMKQLDEDSAFLRRQTQQDDELRREIDGLLARASQDALLLEEETATLRRRLEQANGDVVRLSRAEAELQSQLTNERSRMIPLQAAAERAQAEVLTLTATLEEQSAAAQSEIAALNTRLETAGARANRLEMLNAEQSRRLSEAGGLQRATERRANESQIAAERAAERIVALEEELAAQRNANGSVERARLAALERADQVGKLLQSHEVTVRRAEERLRDMQARLEARAGEQEMLRRGYEQKASETAAEIERLKAELAIAEAGLQSSRTERARQHHAVLNGGPPYRDGAPVLRSTVGVV